MSGRGLKRLCVVLLRSHDEISSFLLQSEKKLVRLRRPITSSMPRTYPKPAQVSACED